MIRDTLIAFGGAALLFAIPPIASAAAFQIILRAVTDRRATACDSVRLWFRSFIARYVPFGALAMAVRLRASHQLRATSRQVWETSLLEQLAAAIAGAAAAVVAFGLAGVDVPVAVQAVLGVGLVFAVGLPRRGAIFGASAVLATGWVAAGVAAWSVTRSVTGSDRSALYVGGAYAVAWLAAFFVVFLPGGLGVREAVFVALLTPAVSFGPAVLVAAVVRLASLAGELLAYALVELAFMISDDASRDRAPAPAPADR